MRAAERVAAHAVEHALIDAGLCWPGDSLQVHPVTTLKLGGEHPHRGSGVAASDRVLAYSLSAGLVRVVNLETGGRTLLRSHTAEVCDVQVCGPDVLCTAAVDGTVVLQQLDLSDGGAASRSTGASHLLTLRLPPDCTRLCCSSTGLCAATTAGAVVLIDVAEAGRVSESCTRSADDILSNCDLSSLPSRASVTRVDFGHPADLAFAPSVRFAVLCQLPTSRLKQQGRQGGRLAVLSGSGDVFVSAVIGPEQAGLGGFEKVHVDEGNVDALAWAADDLLICAADGTKTLLVHSALPNGSFVVSQRVAIVSPSPLRLVSGGGGDLVALCGTALHLMLWLHVDAQRHRIHSTSSFSVESPVISLTTTGSHQASIDAFVVDASSVSRCTFGAVSSTSSASHDFDALPSIIEAASAAVETRLAAKMSSHFEDLTRLVLQSRAEADSKLQAQSAALRRALTEELRECVRSALAPRLDRALGEALDQMEKAVCAGVDVMSAETARAAGLVDAMVERHEQALAGFAAERNRHAASMPESPDKQHSTRDDLCRYIAMHRYESAFSTALESSDVELLSWLCSQLRPEDVFSSSQPMSQEVILSLAQQLGCDLHNNPSTKAVWIRDAVLALNCADPVLLPHIQAILSDLYAQLEREVAECEGGAQPELRLCMRVIKTQLRD